MLKNRLDIKDLELILESLKYTKLKFQDYTKYPSQDFKQKRIDEVNAVIDKVKALKEKN